MQAKACKESPGSIEQRTSEMEASEKSEIVPQKTNYPDWATDGEKVKR